MQHFKKSITIIAVFAISFSLINIANAENVKKAQSKNVQKTTPVGDGSQLMKNELTSFFGIKLAVPISYSFQYHCPKKFEYERDTVDIDTVKLLPADRVCYNSENFVTIDIAQVYIRSVAPFMTVFTTKRDTQLVTGNITEANANFKKSDYNDVLNLLTQKYGPPQEQAKKDRTENRC